jgi:site-specific DNA-methyltransferase (adenine-specific)/modification methylase
MSRFRTETIGDATLYLGDCREILPTLGPVDAVVTDPPYGVRERTKRASAGRGKPKAGWFIGSRDWPEIVGDDEPFDPTPWLAYPKVVLFGANHFCSRLPDAAMWIVWDKREETAPDDNADCEIAWTNLRGPARIHRQLWRGICRRGEENVSSGGERLHPTQKPVALMDFCLRACRLRDGDVVLDPYMGAGATGVAAMRRGLRFVGCEVEPSYFDTACRRIEEAYRQPRLFSEPPPKPVQGSLLEDA